MADPHTRPSEIARIAQLATGDAADYRTAVLLLLTKNEERGKRHEQWMQDHDRLDTTRFNSIEGRLGGVVSGVSDYNDTKSQVEGAKKLIVGTVAALTAIGGFIYFIVWLIKEMRP